MKTYLLTGGAGFIGSNFIHYLLGCHGDNIRLVNLDKLTYAGNLSNLSGITEQHNYFFIQADICDKDRVLSVFSRFRPDIVVNFAAETHVDRSIHNPELFVHTNITGTRVLLDAALCYPVDKFIQISTDEVYGSLGSEDTFSETSPLQPSSPYSASKAGADLLAYAYYKTYSLPINITRCSNNFGPYQYPEKLIPLAIDHCLQQIPIPIYGDGRQVRDWIFVEDHCSAIEAVINGGQPGEIYNIGSNNEMDNLRLVQRVVTEVQQLIPGDFLAHNDLIQHVSDRPGHDRRYALNSYKIQQELKWQPRFKMERSLSTTVKWYIEHPNWLNQIRERMTHRDLVCVNEVNLI